MQNISVRYERKFKKQFDKADSKIRRAFVEKRLLFQQDPFHPQLRNHPLIGSYKGYRSINVTGDWRAVFIEKKVKGGLLITFHVLGTHSQLYR